MHLSRYILSLALFVTASNVNATILTPSQGYSVYTTNGGGNSFITSDMYAGDTGNLTLESARIYEQFNLPTSTPGSSVSSATFSIDVSNEYSNAAANLGLYAVNDDSWTTSTSWQDKANLGALLHSFNPESFPQTLIFDVTSFISSEFLGDGIASFAIAGLTEYGSDNSWHYFSAYTSRLDVTVSAGSVPAPATLALLALGLVAIRFTTKKHTA